MRCVIFNKCMKGIVAFKNNFAAIIINSAMEFAMPFHYKLKSWSNLSMLKSAMPVFIYFQNFQISLGCGRCQNEVTFMCETDHCSGPPVFRFSNNSSKFLKPPYLVWKKFLYCSTFVDLWRNTSFRFHGRNLIPQPSWWVLPMSAVKTISPIDTRSVLTSRLKRQAASAWRTRIALHMDSWLCLAMKIM